MNEVEILLDFFLKLDLPTSLQDKGSALVKIIEQLGDHKNLKKVAANFITHLEKLEKQYKGMKKEVEELFKKIDDSTLNINQKAEKLFTFLNNLSDLEQGNEGKVKVFLWLLSQLEKGARIQSENKENTQKQEEKKVLTLEDKTYQCVVEGSKNAIAGLLKEAIKKYEAQEILNKFMIPAITHVGDLYDQKIYFLPQLLMSADTMKEGMKFLDPYLKEGAIEYKAIIVIATVKGDIHDIGKNIVAIILENYGFKVHDIGKDVSKEVILEKAIEYNANIIALSALMTTTMVEMENFITYMKDQGHDLPVMIGGAVVNHDYAQKIGAHYSADAVGAVELANQLVEK